MREINNNKDMRNFNFLFGNFGQGKSHLSSTCLRYASETPAVCLRQLRYAAVVLFVLTLGVGNVWGGVQKWDLTTNSYSSATGLLVTWSSTGATMTLAKGSGNAPNGYLGNGSDQLHTRFYKDNVLTFTPVSGYTIHKIIITCTSSDYDDGFESSWTNASKSISDGVVTVTPTTGTSACSVILGSSTSPNRVTQVVVIYTTGAEIVVVDPDFNQLDDDNGYDFGTVTTASGSVTISLWGSCLKTMYSGDDPYLIEIFPYGDDETNFTVNNTADYFFNSLTTTFTFRYTGLTTNKKYSTSLWVYGYKETSCKDYPSGADEMVYFEIPISVTYAAGPAASSSPASWDFGNVEVGETVTKTFTITTANLTGNLTVGMYLGDQGMSTTTNSIAQAATSTEVTVSFTPASTGLKEDLLTISGGGLAESLDISITGTGVEMHDIHWVVNGSDWSLNPSAHGYPTTKVVDGTKPSVMPTTPIAGDDGCGSKFMGWTTAPIEGSRGTAPTPCWNSLTYFQNVTSETSYYAVFADEQP